MLLVIFVPNWTLDIGDLKFSVDKQHVSRSFSSVAHSGDEFDTSFGGAEPSLNKKNMKHDLNAPTKNLQQLSGNENLSLAIHPTPKLNC